MERGTLKDVEEGMKIPLGVIGSVVKPIDAHKIARLSPYAKKVMLDHVAHIEHETKEFKKREIDKLPSVKAPDVASAIGKLREVEAESAARREIVRAETARKIAAKAAIERRAAEEAAAARRLAERDEARRAAMSMKAADLKARTKEYLAMSPAERRRADLGR